MWLINGLCLCTCELLQSIIIQNLVGEWPTWKLTLSAHIFGCSLQIRLIEVDCWLQDIVQTCSTFMNHKFQKENCIIPSYQCRPHQSSRAPLNFKSCQMSILDRQIDRLICWLPIEEASIDEESLCLKATITCRGECFMIDIDKIYI